MAFVVFVPFRFRWIALQILILLRNWGQNNFDIFSTVSVVQTLRSLSLTLDTLTSLLPSLLAPFPPFFRVAVTRVNNWSLARAPISLSESVCKL